MGGTWLWLGRAPRALKLTASPCVLDECQAQKLQITSFGYETSRESNPVGSRFLSLKICRRFALGSSVHVLVPTDLLTAWQPHNVTLTHVSVM